jgi:hypothetical protein
MRRTVMAHSKKQQVFETLGVREETNRAALVSALVAKAGKPVAISALMKAVYGSDAAENKGPLKMIVRGLKLMIKKARARYRLVEDQTAEGEKTYTFVIA